MLSVLKKIRLDRRNKNVQKNAKRILMLLKDAMAEKNISWFVDFGTMLGVVRNKRILNWDGDIDAGVVISGTEEYDLNAICEHLQSKGLNLRAINYYKDQPSIIKFVYKRTSVDIHVYCKDEDKLITYLHLTRGKEQIDKNTIRKKIIKLTCSMINGYSEQEVYGMTVPVPSNYETILAEKYGSDWMIENQSWRSEQTPNLEYLDEWGIVKRVSRIKLFFIMIADWFK